LIESISQHETALLLNDETGVVIGQVPVAVLRNDDEIIDGDSVIPS
jgi:hypothetical protein